MDATVPHAERGRRVAPLAELTAIVFDDARLLAFGRLAAIFLVPLTLALVVLLFGTGPVPRRNWYGEILGNDFTQVWVAGRAALEGRAAESYDLARHLENSEGRLRTGLPIRVALPTGLPAAVRRHGCVRAAGGLSRLVCAFGGLVLFRPVPRGGPSRPRLHRLRPSSGVHEFWLMARTGCSRRA
ncbi:hypothetical protein [Methylobacterium komagatae]